MTESVASAVFAPMALSLSAATFGGVAKSSLRPYLLLLLLLSSFSFCIASSNAARHSPAGS
jgi:hypothetical protein